MQLMLFLRVSIKRENRNWTTYKNIRRGNPVTVDEVRKNFDSLIKELVGTNEINRVRLTLKK